MPEITVKGKFELEVTVELEDEEIIGLDDKNLLIVEQVKRAIGETAQDAVSCGDTSFEIIESDYDCLL